MNEFILLMHNDARDSGLADSPAAWTAYLDALASSGQFEGGSSIGPGRCSRRQSENVPEPTSISGFIRVRALSIEHAEEFLIGNPVYEAGGTVEVRELLKD